MNHLERAMLQQLMAENAAGERLAGTLLSCLQAADAIARREGVELGLPPLEAGISATIIEQMSRNLQLRAQAITPANGHVPSTAQ